MVNHHAQTRNREEAPVLEVPKSVAYSKTDPQLLDNNSAQTPSDLCHLSLQRFVGVGGKVQNVVTDSSAVLSTTREQKSRMS